MRALSKLLLLLSVVSCSDEPSIKSHMASSRSLERSTEVPGAIPVQDMVDRLGNFSASVQMDVLPAGNHLEPKLSLSYSSAYGDDSVIGRGWSLMGFSTISRCSSTLAIDGEFHSVDLSSKDRFCLNGEKLILVGGEYGENGSEYRTAIDSNQKIIFAKSPANSFGSFIVKNRAGETHSFGSSSESRDDSPTGNAFAWHLDQISDVNGNSIKYAYTKEDGKRAVLQKVQYGGNLVNSVPHYREISLGYTNEAVSKLTALYGTVFREDRILTSISVTSDANLAWRYDLDYDSTGTQRLLKSVRKCFSDNTCYRESFFDYQKNLSSPKENSPLSSPSFGYQSPNFFTGGNSYRILVDLNNDGFQDQLAITANGIYTGLRTGSGFNSILKIADDPILKKINVKIDPIQVSDVNRDGFPDIVILQTTGANPGIWVALGNGSSFSSFSSWISFPTGFWRNAVHYRTLADFDGDGLPDLIGIHDKGVYIYRNLGDKFQPSAAPAIDEFGALQKWSFVDHPRFIMDVNGDTFPDIVGFHETEVRVSLWNGSSFGKPEVWSTEFGRNRYSSESPRYLVDVNNDGLPDIVGFALDGVRIGLNTGKGFAPSELWAADFGYNQGWTSSTQLRLCFDVNGDGIPDFVGITPQITKVLLGKKRPLSSQELASASVIPLTNIKGWDRKLDPNQLTDLSGSGSLDIAIVLQGGIWSIDWPAAPPLMTTIRDGLGNETRIVYGNTHDGSTYKKSINFAYPKANVPTALSMVKRLDRSTPGYGVRSISYAYENAAYNRLGFGFVGFARITEEDSFTKAVTVRNYFQSTSGDIKDGSISSENSFVRMGSSMLPVNSQENTWAIKRNFSGQFPVQVYLDQSVTKKYELDGTLVATVESDQTYDSLGNLTFQKVSTSGSGETFSTTTENFFNIEDTGKWIIGRLSKSKVTHQRTNADPIVKTAEFHYDVSGNLFEEIQAPDSDLQTVKTYGRFMNKFGLVDTITTKWNASQSKGLDTDFIEESFVFDERGFPKSSKNALVQETEFHYHQLFGKLKDTVDPNGLMASNEYDATGAIHKSISKEGVSKTFKRSFCDASCPSRSIYSVIETSDSDGTAVAYYDAKGQIVRATKSTWNGKSVSVDREYNLVGLLVKESKPYFSDKSALYSTAYEYDELLRPKKTTFPDETFEGITRNGLVEESLGRNGKITRKFKNAVNEVIASENELQQKLRYEFYADGKLKSISDSKNNNTWFFYDALGRQIGSVHPDSGKVDTKFNALNLPYLTTDSSGGTIAMTYDKIGRLKTRVQSGNTESWVYDQKKIGLPDSYDATSSSEQYSYDIKSRLQSVSTKINGRNFSIVRDFDSQNRINSLIYPSGLKVRYEYGSDGTMTAIKDDATGKLYWELKESGADSQILRENLGNGLSQQWNWNQKTGNLDDIIASNSNQIAQNLHYDYKPWGVIQNEEDRIANFALTYNHDDLNRLKTVKRNDTEIFSVDYDDLGNIKSKTGLGSYSYGTRCDGFAAPGPHAVTQIGSNSYCYDAKGQMIVGAGKKIAYNFAGQPTSVSTSTDSATFLYGANRGRVYQLKTASGKKSETYYVSGIFEELVENGEKSQRNFVGSNLIVTIKNSTVEEIYALKNRLGSTSVLTDKNGMIIDRLFYTPWGERADSLGHITSASPSKTPYGFTGHEHLDSFGLIHANGRLYDPRTAQFLSPDPVIQDIFDLQYLNKYAYAANSPLMIIDPSGYSGFNLGKALQSAGRALSDPFGYLSNQGEKLGRWLSQPTNQRQVIGAAVSIAAVWLAGPVLGLQGFQYMAFVAAGNAAGSYIASNGDMTATAVGAIQGFAFAGINIYFNQYTGPLATELKTLSQATAGGVVSALSGGRFEQGFASSGITAGFANYGFANDVGVDFSKSGLSDVAYNTSVMAMFGGSVSQLTGGSFENGATTAAYTSLFGQAMTIETGYKLAAFLGEMVGKVWNAPNTALGLLWGGIGHLAGEVGNALGIYRWEPEIGFGHNGIEFRNNPFVLPGSAMTLGNAIIYGTGITPASPGAYGDRTVNIGRHEEAHTYQSQVLGPLFLPIYFMSGGISGPSNNRFESAAQNYGRAGGGWWPW